MRPGHQGWSNRLSAFFIISDLVTVLADTALSGEQPDEAGALAARQDAEAALKGVSGETDLAQAQAEFAEAEARSG